MHFLLGKPSKYDMKIVYDSVKNILMLDKDGRNIQIITMKDEKGDKNHGNKYNSHRRVED